MRCVAVAWALSLLCACPGEHELPGQPGAETGPCLDGQCLAGLQCLSSLCVDPTQDPQGTDSASTTDPWGTTASTADTTSTTTGGDDAVPVAYRFDCIDVQGLGDAAEDVLQVSVLQNAWGLDIQGYKLNVIVEIVEEPNVDVAMVGIRSAVGSGPTDQCYQPGTVTELVDGTYDPRAGLWVPTEAEGRCSEMADGAGPGGRTYGIAAGPDDLAYLYAEDDDGTLFNCTPDEAVPDAIPLRALTAELTVNSDGTRVSGTVTGCMLESETMSVCTCLAECSGSGPDDLQTDGQCAGCPVGGSPLRDLLGNIGTSQRCTEIMGSPAFDLVLGFSANRLAEVPSTCDA